MGLALPDRRVQHACIIGLQRADGASLKLGMILQSRSTFMTCVAAEIIYHMPFTFDCAVQRIPRKIQK